MEQRLAGNSWTAGEAPSIADPVPFACTYRTDEGGFDLERWPRALAWAERVAAPPGLVTRPHAEDAARRPVRSGEPAPGQAGRWGRGHHRLIVRSF
jgi:glutathione S-transferase